MLLYAGNGLLKILIKCLIIIFFKSSHCTKNLPIKIAGRDQGGALGSAIFGSVAAGKENGGYDDVFTAASKLGKVLDTKYEPNPEAVAVYDKLYAEYKILHDYFGKGANDVMKRLKEIKKSV